jgi:sarcosine oxidase subunit delta
MLILHCPHCGARPETEFVCAGEAQSRPAEPSALDDAAWSDALYARNNTAGWTSELWWHAYGCRLWLRVDRHTVTHEIGSVTRAEGST